MKLVSDIINELIDSEKSISGPLLKTKVLATRLGNDELLNWVNQELEGYSDSKNVPKYRKFGCHVVGDYFNGNMKYTRQPLPLTGFDKSLQTLISNMEFMHSVGALENMVQKKGNLELPFTAEMTGYLETSIIKLGNPHFQLINARKFMSSNGIAEILAIVRNRLLDFMLKIDKEFGNLTEIEDLKSKRNEIANIMNQTIINTSGDGNVINTGDSSSVSSTINISKGNKDQLRKELDKVGVEQSDTNDLLSVIEEMVPTSENQQFGVKVNDWIQKMMGKSLDGSWQVGIGVAGGLLVEIIKKYYLGV